LGGLTVDVFRQRVRLPGKCLADYLVILRRAQLEGTNSVELTTAWLARFGLNRSDKARALRHMEQAGIIRVERRGRHNPLVMILDPDARV
jgi:hypothetical protein